MEILISLKKINFSSFKLLFVFDLVQIEIKLGRERDHQKLLSKKITRSGPKGYYTYFLVHWLSYIYVYIYLYYDNGATQL